MNTKHLDQTLPPTCADKWYLIATKPRQETRAAEHLDNQNIRYLLPEIMIEKSRRGRRVCVKEPMFPGYIFVQLADNSIEMSRIRSTRGVRDFVRFGQMPAKVHPSIIEFLRTSSAARDSSSAYVSQLPQKGDRVEILKGPFAGLDSIFDSLNGEERVVLLVDILGKTQRLTLPLSEVNTNG